MNHRIRTARRVLAGVAIAAALASCQRSRPVAAPDRDRPETPRPLKG